MANSALQAFVAQVAAELVLAQVLIRRCEPGYELRHINDSTCADEDLSSRQLNELRALTQFTAVGAFRPLKSAPNLQSGWRLRVANDR